MPNSPKGARMAYYAQLSQVGIEMAAPIGLGVALDAWLGWAPWSAIVGAVLGLTVGLFHLVKLANREASVPEDDRDQPGAAP